MLRQLLFIVLFAFCVPYSYAEQSTTNPKYEGIEIVVNINQASAAELADLLSGIGEKKAQAIVDYRSQHGEFSSANELTNVKGIGTALVEKNQNRIQL